MRVHIRTTSAFRFALVRCCTKVLAYPDGQSKYLIKDEILIVLTTLLLQDADHISLMHLKTILILEAQAWFLNFLKILFVTFFYNNICLMLLVIIFWSLLSRVNLAFIVVVMFGIYYKML